MNCPSRQAWLNELARHTTTEQILARQMRRAKGIQKSVTSDYFAPYASLSCLRMFFLSASL